RPPSWWPISSLVAPAGPRGASLRRRSSGPSDDSRRRTECATPPSASSCRGSATACRPVASPCSSAPGDPRSRLLHEHLVGHAGGVTHLVSILVDHLFPTDRDT